MTYKKILVTGKTGTVGRNLSGVGFASSRYDLRDLKQTEQLFQDVRPDAVIHCAAKVGGLQLHLKHKYDLFYDNVTINTNVIHSAKLAKVGRVLSYLSSCIFSEASQSPYTEDMIFDGQPFLVHRPYGHAKRALQTQSEICFEEDGLIYNCIIPTNIYGYEDNYNFESGHVVGGLIHRAFLAERDGTDFVVWGDGSQERDFIFTEDIAALTHWALEHYKEKEPLIFSNNQSVSVGYLAHLIAKEFNIEHRVVFDTSKPSGQKIRHLSGDKLASLVNHSFTKIEDGIPKSVKWFVENHPNVRL